ncbi:hypothetical protein [Thiolapillus sp.]|nr:hypothetical protein [Thiolapillus sp.]
MSIRTDNNSISLNPFITNLLFEAHKNSKKNTMPCAPLGIPVLNPGT